jgi:hypothetical protein
MHVVRAAALPLVAIACALPTGGHHHGNGGGQSCTTTTYISDDFSGSLSHWGTISGTPTISASIGNPAPSAEMDSAAAMQDIPSLAATTCGLTVAADIRRDSGFAFMKVVIPGVAKIALLQVFDTVSYYVLCNSSGCSFATELHAVDHAWHNYRFTIDSGTYNGFWFKDGATEYTVSSIGTYASLRVNIGSAPADSAGLGPSLAYFDNFLSTSP